ncbi:hypothetical protein BGZ63DRAFT_377322 [Mariannaea sp. PMI_226]|nr:hypothetical protein BGZ63DRAFT_377322 [Mariannaea sp. PMI_226]
MSQSRSIYKIASVLLSLFFLVCFLGYYPSVTFLSQTPLTMGITHTVLFEFQPDAKPEAIKLACDRFLALQTNCIHPTSKAAYITSLKGGRDNSPENLQGGLTHGFVVEFASADDRDYYVNTDPVHQAYKDSLAGVVKRAVVVDFTNGIY